MEDKKYIYLELSTLNVDPVQYKPYAHELMTSLGRPVYVRIEVSADKVIGGSHNPPDDGIIVTLDGLVEMLGSVAFSIRNKLQ